MRNTGRVEKTVFLSYRRTDFPWAFAIYQNLTHSGFDVFFDFAGISSGDFESIILDNIRARAHFLLVLTPSALERCSDPDDWLRREIEEAIDCHRNIVPILVDSLDFNTVASRLTGKLGALRRYNGLGMPSEYVEAAMEKLRRKFLSVPLEAVLHPASGPALEAAKEQQVAVSVDALTGLVNRRDLEARLEQVLRTPEARRTGYMLCHVNVDQFRLINHTFGHSAGDAVLGQIGDLLKSNARRLDTLARLGGDEFVILLADTSMDEALQIASQLRDEIGEKKFRWDEHSIRLSVSIGVVPITAEYEDVTTLLSAADIACQAAKENGRGRVYGFQENDIDLLRRRREMHWTARINGALEESRFALFQMAIQPLQRSIPGDHFELLLRMKDGDDEVVSPGHFISAASRYRLMGGIDRWVIENALRWLASRNSERDQLALCSINLSVEALRDDTFLPYVIDQFHRSGVDTGKICFEIEETAAIDNFSQTTRFVHALKDFGCRFALDNFGTGLSSFGYLKHLSVDFLKIDGSFVREIVRDPIDREMVRSINEIAHLTGKQTIALHAESHDVLSGLRSIGVDYAQGYGVSQPEQISGS